MIILINLNITLGNDRSVFIRFRYTIFSVFQKRLKVVVFFFWGGGHFYRRVTTALVSKKDIASDKTKTPTRMVRTWPALVLPQKF